MPKRDVREKSLNKLSLAADLLKSANGCEATREFTNCKAVVILQVVCQDGVYLKMKKKDVVMSRNLFTPPPPPTLSVTNKIIKYIKQIPLLYYYTYYTYFEQKLVDGFPSVGND